MKTEQKLELLAVRVAGGQTIKSAADDLRMSHSAAYAITGGDDFRRRVSQIRSEAVGQAVGILSEAAATASTKLVRLLDSDDEKIVLAAAVKLLDKLAPMAEHAELRARLDQIEQQGNGLRIAK